MSSQGLNHLPQELLLQIADLLLDDEDHGDTSDDNEKSISEQKDGHAIRNLSRTCSSFYKILSPHFFRYIRLHNTEKSGKDVRYLCRSNQAANVETLHFKADAPGKLEENFRDVDGVFPIEVNDILSNLSEFPHLKTLIIDFDFHLKSDGSRFRWGDVLRNITIDNTVESKKEMKRAEEREGWRALIKKTLRAVSRNKPGCVRELVYKDAPIRVNSIFGREVFNNWLKGLDSFRFVVYGYVTVSRRQLNEAPRFQQYINNLDRYFFSALQNVTRLAITGNEHGVIGQTARREALVPHRAGYVPKLRELELGYYLIQDDLMAFLIAHSSTLELLTFNHCGIHTPTSSPHDSASSTCWSTWFHTYASSNPQALQHISLKPNYASISFDDDDKNMVPKRERALAKRRAKGWQARVFPYLNVDESYGFLDEMGGFHGSKVCSGVDMGGWDELRSVMRRNRERMRKL